MKKKKDEDEDILEPDVVEDLQLQRKFPHMLQVSNLRINQKDLIRSKMSSIIFFRCFTSSL